MEIITESGAFDVNGPGHTGKLFGLPFTPENSRLTIVPVPWEATVSYHTGTDQGPDAILKASSQIDFFMRQIQDAWKLGIAMLPVSPEIKAESDRLRILVNQYHMTSGDDVEFSRIISSRINEGCESLNIYVKQVTKTLLAEGKMVGVLGGDHSTPLGFLRALSEMHSRFGILHIDAHADLRKSYEGLMYSHGSIMHNALKFREIERLVQVGIRDFCEEEYIAIERSKGRIKTFFDDTLKSQADNGVSWKETCSDIISHLPEKVYISFDIDGLDPSLCPNTGTPVPGGLDFFQAATLIQSVAASGRTIIGFDLNEVAPGTHHDWDGNVGARILWQLCNWMGVSQGMLTMTTASTS